MKIELYLKTEKGAVRGTGREILPPMGYFGIGKQKTSWHAKATFIDYSKKGNRIKKTLEDIASKHNYELEIYDISNSQDAIYARTKGIRDAPAVIIDHHKFEDDFKMNDVLEHIFGTDISKAGYKDESKKYICPKCSSDNIEVYDDLSGFCNVCNGPFMKGEESK